MKGKGLKSKDKTYKYYQFGALAVALCLVVTAVGIATITFSESTGILENGNTILQKPFDFEIYIDGSDYVAINNSNGLIRIKSTNFSTVINDCIQSVAVTKPVSVHLGTGAFYLGNASINVSDRRVHLAGNGIGQTSIRPPVNFNKWVIRGNGTNDITWNMYQQFAINGRGSLQSAGGGFYFDDSNGGHIKDVHIDHVFVEETYSWGLKTDYAWGFCITNSIFERSHNDGGIYSDSNSNMRIIDCRFGANKGVGLKIDGKFHRVSNCEFEGNDEQGLVLIGGNNIINANLFRADSADSNDEAEIKIYGVSDWNVITNNIFDGNGVAKWGIELIGNYNIINDNQFKGFITSNFSTMGGGNIFNGLSYNVGVPGSAGDWASYTVEDVLVWDTLNSGLYIYANSTWNQITLT